MMVMRPSTMTFKTSSGSRDPSPSRVTRSSVLTMRKLPSPQKAANEMFGGRRQSPIRAQRTPGSSPDRRFNRQSPVGWYGNRSRGTSPSKSSTMSSLVRLPRSRGSESGSIDRLDSSGHMTRIITTHPQTEDNINVVVRVRPLSSKEEKTHGGPVIQFPGNGQLLCDCIPNGPNGNQKPKLFSYNVVFEPGATQEDVFQYSGIKRLLEMAVEGFSCTAFCYGQTGSGKTHTMTGPPRLFERNPDPYSDSHGLIFRSFMYLFKLIQNKSDVHFVLKASFLEIYNEKVIDLLNPGNARKSLAVRWNKRSRSFFVENLFTVDCEEFDDLMAVLEEGMKNRKVGSHNMNDYSSRSHTILTIRINSEEANEGGVFISRQGKINFVDLAGSEITKKTQSEGKTLEEANNINKSLMVLGYCIASLSDNKKKNGHIPYRDSKLTKLLADSLAGNGVTLMIACISPAKYNLNETLNTLRYAARAKKIRTKPIVVMDPREALILTLKREVSTLQTENEHLRGALHLNRDPIIENLHIHDEINTERRPHVTQPKIDLEKLTELEGPELIELVRLYISENEALRRENSDLFVTRELLIRDQDLVCRENERLLKKLEDVNLVCCRSPIIPARPAFSADALNEDSNTNMWTNPLNNSNPDIPNGKEAQMPESIQKELEKRRIGNSTTNFADSYRSNTHLRHNSWDSRAEAESKIRPNGSGSADKLLLERRQSKKDYSTQASIESGKRGSSSNSRRLRLRQKDVFGSLISLDDEVFDPMFSFGK